jgi:hypothetical protein
MSVPGSQYGNFIPTTSVWDVSAIYSTEGITPELKELLVRMYQNLNLMALSLNNRDNAFYDTNEVVNGQLFFPNPLNSSATQAYPAYRQVYRKVINFGALPNSGIKSAPHGITFTSNTTITRFYGAATQPLNSITPGVALFIPLPFASPISLIDNIELSGDQTNVYVTTGIDYSSYTVSYIIVEYLQS